MCRGAGGSPNTKGSFFSHSFQSVAQGVCWNTIFHYWRSTLSHTSWRLNFSSSQIARSHVLTHQSVQSPREVGGGRGAEAVRGCCIMAPEQPVICWNEISEESVGSRGLAEPGNLCLRRWEASDLSVKARGAELQTHHQEHARLWCPTRLFFPSPFPFVFPLFLQWKLEVQTLNCLPYLCENGEGKLLFLALLPVWKSLLLCTRQIWLKDPLGSYETKTSRQITRCLLALGRIFCFFLSFFSCAGVSK